MSSILPAFLFLSLLVCQHIALPVTTGVQLLRLQDAELNSRAGATVEPSSFASISSKSTRFSQATQLNERSEQLLDRQLHEMSWPGRKHKKVPDLALKSRRPEKFLEHYHCQREPVIDAAFEFLQTSGVQLDRSFLTEQFTSMCGDCALFTIKNQSVSFKVNESHPKMRLLHDRSHVLHFMVADLLEEVELPDMQFLYNPMDGAQRGGHGVLKREGRPGQDLLAVAPSLSDWGDQVQESAARVGHDCESKPGSFAVFRGTTTGLWDLSCDSSTSAKKCTLDAICCQQCPRANVLRASKQRPDLLDAGVVRVFGQYKAHTRVLTDVLQANGLWKNFTSDAEQVCYSAIVVVDGDALPDRLPRQLGYGLPVVFVHPATSDEFWYPELKPGVHYAPASTENLTNVLEVLKADPDAARRIGERGRQFVLNNLSERRLRCYLYALLTRYANKMQRDGVTTETEVGLP